MPDRQKLLYYSAFGLTGFTILYALFFSALIVPARENRDTAAAIRADIDDLELKLEKGDTYKANLRKWAGASFGDEELAASQQARAHLVQLLTRSRLNNAEVTLTPQSGKRVTGAKEIGWLVKTRGPVDRVVDLLYLLQTDPKLHRIDTVDWKPVPRSTDVDLTVKYMTLVVEPIAGDKAALVKGEDKDKPPMPEPNRLEDPARKRYALIAQRDLFRPYIKRPPPPPVAQQAPPVNKQTLMKVVGLPMWKGKPTVVVKDTEGNTTSTFDIGDDLMGGKIVTVDYRPLPDPRKPILNSGSRVIVLIGKDYWAVEIGQSLAERRKLNDSQLPDGLKSQSQAAPAAQVQETPVTQETSDVP